MGQKRKYNPNKDMRLVAIKAIINGVVPAIHKAIPRRALTKRATLLLEDILYNVGKGLPIHPDRFYDDGNFPRFFEALRKALLYIAETDGHYRCWLGMFLLTTRDILNDKYEKFDHMKHYRRNKEIFKSLKPPKPGSEAAKRFLFTHYILEHPFIAATKNVSIEDMKRHAEAEDRKQRLARGQRR